MFTSKFYCLLLRFFCIYRAKLFIGSTVCDFHLNFTLVHFILQHFEISEHFDRRFVNIGSLLTKWHSYGPVYMKFWICIWFHFVIFKADRSIYRNIKMPASLFFMSVKNLWVAFRSNVNVTLYHWSIIHVPLQFLLMHHDCDIVVQNSKVYKFRLNKVF